MGMGLFLVPHLPFSLSSCCPKGVCRGSGWVEGCLELRWAWLGPMGMAGSGRQE